MKGERAICQTCNHQRRFHWEREMVEGSQCAWGMAHGAPCLCDGFQPASKKAVPA